MGRRLIKLIADNGDPNQYDAKMNYISAVAPPIAAHETPQCPGQRFASCLPPSVYAPYKFLDDRCRHEYTDTEPGDREDIPAGEQQKGTEIDAAASGQVNWRRSAFAPVRRQPNRGPTPIRTNNNRKSGPATRLNHGAATEMRSPDSISLNIG